MSTVLNAALEMSTIALTQQTTAAAPLAEDPKFRPEAISKQKADATAIDVRDAESREIATIYMVDLKKLMEEAHSIFDPICAAANLAHKTATSKRTGVIEPLETAYKFLGGKVAAYDLAERQRIEAEQQRQIAEARRVAEEEQQRQIAAARAQAEQERERQIEEAEAQRASPETIEALCNAPLSTAEEEMIRETPVVIMPVFAPRQAVSSPVSTRVVYKGLVTNKQQALRYIVENPQYLELVDFNETKLNRLVSSMGAAFRFPGVQLTQSASAVTRSARVGS